MCLLYGFVFLLLLSGMVYCLSVCLGVPQNHHLPSPLDASSRDLLQLFPRAFGGGESGTVAVWGPIRSLYLFNHHRLFLLECFKQ